MAIEDRYEALRAAYESDKVGRRVRVLRLAWEMSQSAMARHLNTKPNTISQIESGVSRPAVDIEIRIKAAFGVTIDWIRFGEMAGLSLETIQRLEESASMLGPGAVAEKGAPAKKPRSFSRPARKGVKRG